MATKDHPCMVESCPLEGHNQVGIRCRVAHDGASPFPNKKRTDAIYSIETDGFLCDSHALKGGTFLIMFEPSDSEDVTVEVLSKQAVEARTKHIKQPDEVA